MLACMCYCCRCSPTLKVVHTYCVCVNERAGSFVEQWSWNLLLLASTERAYAFMRLVRSLPCCTAIVVPANWMRARTDRPFEENYRHRRAAASVPPVGMDGPLVSSTDTAAAARWEPRLQTTERIRRSAPFSAVVYSLGIGCRSSLHT
jgi:hypothetical protein